MTAKGPFDFIVLLSLTTLYAVVLSTRASRLTAVAGTSFTGSLSSDLTYTCKSPHPCEYALNPLPGDEEQASGTDFWPKTPRLATPPREFSSDKY